MDGWTLYTSGGSFYAHRAVDCAWCVTKRSTPRDYFTSLDPFIMHTVPRYEAHIIVKKQKCLENVYMWCREDKRRKNTKHCVTNMKGTYQIKYIGRGGWFYAFITFDLIYIGLKGKYCWVHLIFIDISFVLT